MTWQLPLVALHLQGILDALDSAPMPNQGGYAVNETAEQFQAARDAARAILASGNLGSEGIFTVRLTGSAQSEHGMDIERPLEEIIIEIARHAPQPMQEYTAGPVTVRLSSGPIDPADSAPIEALRIDLARHLPRTGRRSY